MPYAEFDHGTKVAFVDAVCDSNARPGRLVETMNILRDFDQETRDAWEPMIEEVQKVIDTCLSSDPRSRPTSTELVGRLNDIIKMELICVPSYATDIWTQLESQNLVDRFHLHLDGFLAKCRDALASSQSVPDADKKYILKCIPRALGCADVDEEKKMISLPAFSTFFHVYSHLKCLDLTHTLAYFLECIKLPFFFGHLNSAQKHDTQESLQPGQFLVRYSSRPSPISRLTLCYRPFVRLSSSETAVICSAIMKYDGSLDVTVGLETNFAVRLEALVHAALPTYEVPSVPTPFRHLLKPPIRVEYVKK